MAGYTVLWLTQRKAHVPFAMNGHTGRLSVAVMGSGIGQILFLTLLRITLFVFLMLLLNILEQC